MKRFVVVHDVYKTRKLSRETQEIDVFENFYNTRHKAGFKLSRKLYSGQEHSDPERLKGLALLSVEAFSIKLMDVDKFINSFAWMKARQNILLRGYTYRYFAPICLIVLF